MPALTSFSCRFQVVNGTLWAVYPKHSRYYSRGEDRPSAAARPACQCACLSRLQQVHASAVGKRGVRHLSSAAEACASFSTPLPARLLSIQARQGLGLRKGAGPMPSPWCCCRCGAATLSVLPLQAGHRAASLAALMLALLPRPPAMACLGLAQAQRLCASRGPLPLARTPSQIPYTLFSLADLMHHHPEQARRAGGLWRRLTLARARLLVLPCGRQQRAQARGPTPLRL